jgi:hypothetical protein
LNLTEHFPVGSSVWLQSIPAISPYPPEFPFTKLKLYRESGTGKWKLNFGVTEEDQVRTVGVERLWRFCFGETRSETTDRLGNGVYFEGLVLTVAV